MFLEERSEILFINGLRTVHINRSKQILIASYIRSCRDLILNYLHILQGNDLPLEYSSNSELNIIVQKLRACNFICSSKSY
jgi:hypothetical protein